MEFTVQLFVQAHHHGFYTVHVLGEPSLVVHTDDLDQAREDLGLVLADRFERMHPRLVGKYAEAGGLAAHTVSVPDALVVDGPDGPTPRPTDATVLVGADRRWWRVHAPRWDVRAWVPRAEDVDDAASLLLAEHAKQLREAQRLGLRREGDEWIEPLVVEAEGAQPAQFVGTWRTADFLPEPGPPKGADGEREEPGADQGAKGRGAKRPPTPTLTRVGVALHAQAKDGELERAYGRDADVQALLGQLAYKGACVAVVGDPGVGKTAVLNELAQSVYEDTKDGPLKARPVFFADASRLIAGQGFFGDWQQQVLDVVNEAIEADVVLYLGDVLALLDAGKSAYSDQNVALLLKPYLAGGRLTVVGEASTAAWAKLELRDAGFARLFAPYRLAEPKDSDLPDILTQVAAELGDETGLTVLPDAIAAVDELTTRFRGDGARLGQAVHFLRRLLDDAAFQAEQAEDDRPPAPIGRPAVVARLCAETGMPEFLIQDQVPLDPAAVQAHFRARLIGQDDAVRRMTDLVAVMKAGLADLGRPLGSFLFVGPTGVGKTEMAKALAEFLFGRRDRLTRFDMSEFVRPDSVHRFLGDAGEEGLLISQIRRQPFCVLLLDEVEKAHPAVFDVLLQVLGEARLTDQAGRTADFRNTVVLMTSNLGVETFKRRPGFGRAPTADAFKQHFLAEAERFFRPELFNRLDHIVPFLPLEAPAIDRITGRELAAFAEREGLKQRGIELSLGDGVHPWIAARGVEPRYGARPLKRLIERRLTAPLAQHLAGRQIAPGHGVQVAVEGEALRFSSTAGQGQKGPAAARKAVRAFLDQVGVLRWQVQQWLGSPPLREARQAVRLVDRLASQPRFWDDREAAEARTRKAQLDRVLVEGFDRLGSQLAGVEDLAYEAFHARDDGPLEALAPELTDVGRKLDELEVALLARAWPNPDECVLYLKASEDGDVLLRQLVEAYTALAQQHGWALSVRTAKETAWARQAREAREAKDRAKARRAKDDEGEPTGRRKRRTGSHLDDPRAWSWGKWHTLDVPSAEPADSLEKRERVARRVFVDAAKASAHTRVRVLRFQGANAAVWLAHEAGAHILTGQAGGATPTVRVLSQGGDLRLTNPAELRLPQHKRRLIQENQRQVLDPELGLGVPFKNLLAEPYRRLQRAALYHGVFGEGAHRLFARGDS